jgi:hypothetical protein
MNLFLAIAIVVVMTSLAIVAMLVARRHAPEGSHFKDGDRAAGVFGVLATGFSVLIGFVVFLAFSSYDQARVGAESEARVVAQQVETAQFFPPAAANDLSGELVCYARSVTGIQWQRMENGTIGEELNPWATRLFETLQTVDPQTPAEQAAYSKWLDERTAREEARSDRIHGAIGVVPLPLWVVLFFISLVLIVYMLFFADSGEAAVVQAFMMGSVAAILVSMLCLLQFLNNPYHPGVGGLRPVAMERALTIIDEELRVAHRDIQPPCDAAGNPL